MNLLVSVAQWEREAIGERTAAALAAKRRRGEKTKGDAPFGYAVDTATGRLIEAPQEQTVIRLVKDLREHGFGYKAIARELNKAGYRTKREKPWCQVTVQRVVKRLAA